MHKTPNHFVRLLAAMVLVPGALFAGILFWERIITELQALPYPVAVFCAMVAALAAGMIGLAIIEWLRAVT